MNEVMGRIKEGRVIGGATHAIPTSEPISMPEGWRVSDLQTWRMRLCEHPTGAIVVFMEDWVVIHRPDNAQGREAAREI